MTPFRKRRLSTSLLIAAVLASTAAGCGDDFENELREPVPVELTGVIQTKKLTVSPREVGGGPISITISNQTDEAHTVTLEGIEVREMVGPVNPGDTATIQKTVVQGTYEVHADSDGGASTLIRPAELKVGPERDPSNDRILLP